MCHHWHPCQSPFLPKPCLLPQALVFLVFPSPLFSQPPSLDIIVKAFLPKNPLSSHFPEATSSTEVTGQHISCFHLLIKFVFSHWSVANYLLKMACRLFPCQILASSITVSENSTQRTHIFSFLHCGVTSFSAARINQ